MIQPSSLYMQLYLNTEMRFFAISTIFFMTGATLAFEDGFLRAFNDGVDILIEESVDKVETYEDVEFNYTISCERILELVNLSKKGGKSIKKLPDKLKIKFCINDSSVAKIMDSSKLVTLNCVNDTLEVIHLTAGHLGITKMLLELVADEDLGFKMEEVEIRIKRKVTLFDVLSFYILAPLILLNKCAFGAKIDIKTLVHIFTQPMALGLCLLMQFIVMPLYAFIYGSLFGLSEALALAMFVGATCPGGGGGYILSYLIGGDVTLAISASLLSTLVAMGAMPLIIGLYSYIRDVPDTLTIPYVKMILILCIIAIPISTGMLINKKRPKFAKLFVKIIRPLSLFLIICGFLFLAVTSKYIIHGPTIGWVLGFLLPFSGYASGLLIARCFGLSWPFSKAISLETGMKNTVLGIAVIELTYPQPEADLSSILIIMVTLGHTSLAMLWYFFHLFQQSPRKHHDRKAEFMKLENIDSDEDVDD